MITSKLLTVLALTNIARSHDVTYDPCDITAWGALSGNYTKDAVMNGRFIQQALDSHCDRVIVPPGVFKTTPITIPSNTELYLSTNSVLVGSDEWADYGETHFMPPIGSMLQMKPLVSVFDAANVSITGGNGTIDGNGWYAWPTTNWSSPDCGLHGHCTPSVTLGPQKLKPAHVITFTHSSNTVISNVTITNPPFWGLQHFFCNDTVMEHVTILAPRWTREIAGFMPFSVRNYTVRDSFVHVGDDAVAIMSGPDWTDPYCAFNASQECKVSPYSVPSMGMRFERLFVRGRSVAIGSEDFGNVTDVIFRDCTIGDDYGSCPWAFKIKMHSNIGCEVANIAVENTKFGLISANTWQDPQPYAAIQIGTSYSNVPVNPSLPQPRIRNISFTNVTATGTTIVGSLVGGYDPITGLHFQDCNFRSSARNPWELKDVNLSTCTSVNSTPTFPTDL